MSEAHNHGGHNRALQRDASRGRLLAALCLAGTYLVAEVVGGLLTGSLALLADAGHMLTDVASLSLALGALWMARRPPTTRHTFAFARVEILAALVNGLFLWGIVAWIAWEAIGRMQEPQPVLAGPMMGIAAGGLVVNGIAFRILHRDAASDRSLNLHGALLHVLGDLFGSAGALIAGGIVLLTGWSAADPLASLLIGVLILVSSWRLVREAIHVLMEGAPRELDVDALLEAMCGVEGVVGVHDLHVWTITSGYPALAVHVVCRHEEERDLLLARVNRLLRERFGIDHTTIQLEPEAPPGHGEPMAHPLERVE